MFAPVNRGAAPGANGTIRYHSSVRWQRGVHLSGAPPVVLAGAGIGSVALGAYLLADPLVALRLLVVLVGAGLLVTGGAELLTAERGRWPWLRRGAGMAWLAGGVAALAWPGALRLLDRKSPGYDA